MATTLKTFANDNQKSLIMKLDLKVTENHVKWIESEEISFTLDLPKIAFKITSYSLHLKSVI